MKKFYIAALAAASIFTASAQNEVLKIELNNGTTQTIAVSDIKQMTFDQAEESIAGSYSGTVSDAVGSMATYTADITVTIEENADGTINFIYPEYQLTGTVMGDLTLGTVTIPNIPFSEEKGGYYLDYSDLALTQHFTAVNGGNTTMDNDYTLGSPSTILIVKGEDGISVTNPFKLGAMPFPLTSTFEGKK